MPADLPDAPFVSSSGDKDLEAEAEARWEKRATLLVEGNQRSRSGSSAASTTRAVSDPINVVSSAAGESPETPTRSPMGQRRISDQQGDVSALLRDEHTLQR